MTRPFVATIIRKTKATQHIDKRYRHFASLAAAAAWLDAGRAIAQSEPGFRLVKAEREVLAYETPTHQIAITVTFDRVLAEITEDGA